LSRHSGTGNVTKICGCAKWKECTHPWYVYYCEGKDIVDGKVRLRRLRGRLADLVGREPKDYADAKAEAQRAIVAWRDGRDATTLIPGDAPTVAKLLEEYAKRPGGAARDSAPIERVIINGRKFGEWPAESVTREMVEAFRRQRPTIAANRDLALLRAAFNWAILGGLVPATPFKVGTVAAVKLAREEARTRRLHPGEEERLLLAANGLKDLIVAALETGCRLGELLSMEWSQVRNDLFLPAGKTKAKKNRRVPISTVLQRVLDARRHDPAGDPLPADAFVFGDEIGRQRHSIKTAWKLTCKRAKIDGLHFHDLRREAGSRWMDAGVPLATIQRWLGHHNISQTSTYLAATGGGDADAMRAFEVAAGRLANIGKSGDANGSEQTPSSSEGIEEAQSNATIH